VPQRVAAESHRPTGRHGPQPTRSSSARGRRTGRVVPLTASNVGRHVRRWSRRRKPGRAPAVATTRHLRWSRIRDRGLSTRSGRRRCAVLRAVPVRPGEIGKSGLVEVLGARAERTRAHVVRPDGRHLPVSVGAVLDALAASLSVPDGEGPIRSSAGRIVLLIDSYEHMAPLDDWLRTRLMPRVPPSTLTVIAGRTAPSPAWRADPAWCAAATLPRCRAEPAAAPGAGGLRARPGDDGSPAAGRPGTR
jgi:hypothetical protein